MITAAVDTWEDNIRHTGKEIFDGVPLGIFSTSGKRMGVIAKRK